MNTPTRIPLKIELTCSDGKRFPQEQREEAQKHQDAINLVQAFVARGEHGWSGNGGELYGDLLDLLEQGFIQFTQKGIDYAFPPETSDK